MKSFRHAGMDVSPGINILDAAREERTYSKYNLESWSAKGAEEKVRDFSLGISNEFPSCKSTDI